MRSTPARLFCACLMSACAVAPVSAAEGDGATFTAVVENDNFALTYKDKHYTNGIYLSWTSPPTQGGDYFSGFVDGIADASPGEIGSYRHTFFLGQSIFTPKDLARRTLDANDRPYAGWLYGGVKAYRETDAHLDRLGLSLGVVGPWSLANEAQVWIHSVNPVSPQRPNGWTNQIHNEPGFVVSHQRIWRSLTLPVGGLEAEMLPQTSLAFGNILTYAGAGLSLRLGQHLDADWGPPAIAPSLEGTDFVHRERGGFAWYVFGGVEGRAVARNIFLDGNTFRDSPSVAKNHLVGDVRAGVAMLMGGVNLYLTYTLRSHEFKKQKADDRFAALGISFTN